MLKMTSIPATTVYNINCYYNSIPLDVYTCVEIKADKKGNPLYVYEGEKSGKIVSLHCHKLLTSKNAEQLLKDRTPAFQAQFSYDRDTDTFVVLESSVKHQTPEVVEAPKAEAKVETVAKEAELVAA